jgi:UDP-glucose 4-epimerase
LKKFSIGISRLIVLFEVANNYDLVRCDSAYQMKSVCLRYFNACGADESGDIGEDHATETHLIPLVLQVRFSNIDLKW